MIQSSFISSSLTFVVPAAPSYPFRNTCEISTQVDGDLPSRESDEETIIDGGVEKFSPNMVILFRSDQCSFSILYFFRLLATMELISQFARLSKSLVEVFAHDYARYNCTN